MTLADLCERQDQTCRTSAQGFGKTTAHLVSRTSCVRAALVLDSRLCAIRAEQQQCFAVTQYVLSPILACSHSKPLIHACAFLLKAQDLLYPSPAPLRLLLRRIGPRGLAAVGSLGQPPSARAPKLSSTFFRGTWTLPRSASNKIDSWQVVPSSRGSVCLQLR